MKKLHFISLIENIIAKCPKQARREKELAQEKAKHGDYTPTIYDDMAAKYPLSHDRDMYPSSYPFSSKHSSFYGKEYDLPHSNYRYDISWPGGYYSYTRPHGSSSWSGEWSGSSSSGSLGGSFGSSSSSSSGGFSSSSSGGFFGSNGLSIVFGAGRFSGAGYSNSGASGTSFKFTHLSMEASTEVADYKRSFIGSKVFIFNPSADGFYKVIMVSTTKFYHPQLKISEINQGGGEKYVELGNTDHGNGIYGTKYDCKKGRKYLAEIGTSEKVNSAPFENNSSGGFVCSISAQKKSLQECLGEQECKISINGKTGIVSTENHKELILSESSSSSSSMGGSSSSNEVGGSLDYSVTPYLDELKGSVTLYYHSESSYSYSQSSYSSSSSASTVEFSCGGGFSYSSSRVSNGVKRANNAFEFSVESKGACDLTEMLL